MRIRVPSLHFLILIAPLLAAESLGAQAQALDPARQTLQALKVGGAIHRVRARQLVDEDGNLTWDYTVLGRDPAPRPVARSQAAPDPRKALVNCFQSTITNGFFSVGTTGTEWVDWARKDAGKAGLVGAFAFAYASNALSPKFGGPGSTIGISFFSGTTGFCSRGSRVDVPGDPDDIFDFTGLPGDSVGSGSLTPGFAVTALLHAGSVFCLPDGKIGWSYIFREPPMGTTRNSTGPLLTGLHANTCWSDVFDLWSSPIPLASCAGTFNFGGCAPPLTFSVPNPCAGFWIKIFEASASPGSSLAFNDTGGINPVRYSEIQSANLGEAWVTNVLVDPLNAAGPEVAGVIRFGVPGTIFSTGLSLGFLVNGSRLVLLGSATNIVVSGAGNPKVGVIGIPKNLDFLGSVFHTQAFGVILSGGVKLQALNGLSITVGVI